MRKFLAAAVLLTLLATALTVSGAPGSGASATTTPSGTAPITAAIGTVGGTSSTAFPTPIRHVFVVVMENEEAKSVLSGGPFETSLAEKYSYASNYFGACHPSTPNYLALTSGNAWQCGTNNFHTYNTSNLGNLLQSAGLSWDGFMETMPKPCDTHGYSSYSPDPNAFVHYWNIVGNPTLCDAHDVPFTTWYNDVSAGTIPNYALFVPNLTDDGHNTGLAYADNWLKHWLTPYLSASWFSSSVWFITYDEGLSGKGYTSGGTTVDGGNVILDAVSPYTLGVHRYPSNPYTADATHYNLMTTVEWLLGLGHTPNHDNPTYFPPMKALFNFSKTTTPLGVGITASPTAGVAPLTVNFTSSPTGGAPPYAYLWKFGNGVTSRVQDPTYTYPKAHDFTASVTVTDSKGATASAAEAIKVGAAPSPISVNLTATPVFGSPPLEVNFSSAVSGGTVPYTYSWNFSGFGTSSLADPSWTFPTAGSFNVSLAVNDSSGSNTSRSVTVEVGPTAANLSASAFATPAVGTAPLGVNFTAYVAGGVAPYVAEWSFGDGTNVSATNASHVYAAPGTYDAVFMVRDSNNSTAQAWANVTVFAPLSVNLTANATRGPAPLNVSFSALVSGGEGPFNFTWTYGDNNSSVGGGASNHSYAAPGTYAASVVVQDGLGDSANASVNISVLPTLQIQVVAPVSAPTSGEAVTLSMNSSSNLSVRTVRWTVDGLPVGNSSRSMVFVPPSAGVYVVSVTVVTTSGESYSTTTTLTVQPPTPTAGSGPELPAAALLAGTAAIGGGLAVAAWVRARGGFWGRRR